jgi:hypothetical protein
MDLPMSLLEGSLVALLLALALALALLWHQHRQAVSTRQEAERILAISRETAARQLIELRAALAEALAEAQSERDKKQVQIDEVARLRNKYRRLYGNYTKLAEHLAEHLPDSPPPDSSTTGGSKAAEIAPETRPGPARG